MASKSLVVVAGLVAAGGVGLIAFAGKSEGTRPVVTAQALSSELDATLRAATTGVHARAETLAGLPSIPDSVSTDAGTVQNLTSRERMFQPLAGETITLGQVPKVGGPSVLLVLPDGGKPATGFDHDGPRLAIDKGALVLTDVVSVTPSEPSRAAELRGALAISTAVDLASVKERLDAMGVAVRIVIDGQELKVGDAKPERTDVSVPLVLSGTVGRKLRVIAAVHAPPAGLPMRGLGTGAIALGVVLLGFGLRRQRLVSAETKLEPGALTVVTPVPPRHATLSSGMNPAVVAEGSIIDGTYEIVGLLGKGGMGTVWEARHLRLPDKRVAVKILTIEGQTEEHLGRFQREAEITSKLGHPNIVGVLDFNTLPSGQPYIVLELLAGETLADRIYRGALPFDEALEYTKQIGSALHAAHLAGIVHRDLKPDNIFLTPTLSGKPLVKVLDFGISKMRGSVAVKTQEAAVFGTPQYMSPEQANGKNSEVDARTDIWALGAIFYEMVTGHTAFSGDTMTTLLVSLLVNPSPSLRGQVELPEHVLAAIDRALTKAPDERWPDMPSFVAALSGG